MVVEDTMEKGNVTHDELTLKKNSSFHLGLRV